MYNIACLRSNDLSTGVRATAAMVAGTQSSLSASAGLVGAAVSELLLPALREHMPAARSALPLWKRITNGSAHQQWT